MKPILIILSLLFALSFSTTAFSQAPPPKCGDDCHPPYVPIDGGLSVLAVAGGAYAIKKLRERK